MTRGLRTSSAVSFALAATLALLCLVCGAAGASALPSQAPISFAFDGLLPGVPSTQSSTIEIPRDATITAATLVRGGPVGAVAWDASVCSASHVCIDLTASPVGALVDRGDYQLVVTVTALTLQPGQIATLDGRISFVERSGTLATTGSDLVWPAVAAAAALTTVGMLLVLLARRRRDDEDGHSTAASS